MIKSKKSIICLVASLGLISVANTTPVHAASKTVQASVSNSNTSKLSNSANKSREYVSKLNNLNVRTATKSNAKVLGKLKKGEVVIGVKKMSNGWIKVEYKGKTGYVSNANNKYLKEGPYVEDRTSANKVIKEIKAISKTVTTKDKTKINKARKSYNTLNKSAKSLVTNYSTLTKAESALTKLENKASADKVITDIKSISKNVTLKDKTKVTKARKSYNALNKTAKSLVTNYSTLTKAESAITKLEEALKENQKQASEVMELISKLDKVIALSDAEVILQARNAFNELNSDAQAMVSNIAILLNAESELIRLEKIKFNQEQASSVMDLIASAPSVISLDDKAYIEEVRTTYNNLTQEVKAMVTNVDILLNAELEISRLEKEQVDKEKSQEVIDMIFEIRALEDLSLDNKDLIVKVRAAYNSLNQEAKAMISQDTLSILEDAESKIVKLEKEKNDIESAQKVEAQINSLNRPLIITDYKTIINIRNEFNRLSKEAKLLVSNVSVLENAEAEINVKKVRYDKAMNLIGRLPDDITLEHEAQILEARQAFEDLSQDEKDHVLSMKYHYQILTRAEEALERLKNGI